MCIADTQRLRIGIGTHKLNALHARANHVLHRITAASAYANHFDLRARVESFYFNHFNTHVVSPICLKICSCLI